MASDVLRARTTANRRRAGALVAVCSGPLGVAVGLIVWWASSWPFAIVGFAAGTAFLAVAIWWAAEPLAKRALGGVRADPWRHARLINLVEGLCATIGVRKPALRVRDESSLNAAVCGRRRRSATLVVTQGLLEELDRLELEGVLAQLLTRIRCYDMLPATVTVATLGIGASLLSPPEPVTALDRAAVGFTRYPPALASAFEKMEMKGTEVRGASRATALLWFAEPGGAAKVPTPLRDRAEALAEL
jgi:Zn-dependent protease with chaperone function